jgi:hypothetical protein
MLFVKDVVKAATFFINNQTDQIFKNKIYFFTIQLRYYRKRTEKFDS